MEESNLLKELYYTAGDSGSFGGVDRLFRRAKEVGLKDVTRAKVAKFLSAQRSYSLHKPSRRNFRRNSTLVSGIDSQWQADLADMQGLSRQNSGYKYLLTCIDVFSKHAWVVPVKDKSGKEIKSAFHQLFQQAYPRKPQRLQTDQGKEFFNKEVKNYLREIGVELFYTYSDKKAAVVERFNRTLKTRIWTYFSANDTKRYVDVLQDLVKAYNGSKHRSIGMAPAQVRKEDEDKIWLRLYGSPHPPPTKLIPGEKVRVSRVKGIFEKGYLPNWTEQHYRISGADGRKKRVYKLQNLLGEDIDGSYYPEELQSIPENQFKVEKILKRRHGKGDSEEALVKWKGWSEKFNTWVPIQDGRPVPSGPSE